MKFSLRDLFWLVLVVAIGAGWFADNRSTARALHQRDIRIRKELRAIMRENYLLHREVGRPTTLPSDWIEEEIYRLD
ncbi:hypothetical protein NA78x_000037 [Anatilimnocola sp. NA78]|uniref:hypothetical protein n=1 Tax=Anatilimnocola sp. NA78 TaxID=3415683 RepID=UPI003CE4570B